MHGITPKGMKLPACGRSQVGFGAFKQVIELPTNRRRFVASLLPDCVAVVEGPFEAEPGDLWPEEAAYIASAAIKRQAEFACGRSFARRAFGALGSAPGPLLGDADRVPSWPNGLTGSITHTRNYCAVAVARRTAITAIGIDVENIDRVRPELFSYFLTAHEITANLQGFDAVQQQRRGAAIFSAKEALYKCLQRPTGTKLGFHDVAVDLDKAPESFEVALLVAAGEFNIGHRFAGRYALDGDRVATAVCLTPKH